LNSQELRAYDYKKFHWKESASGVQKKREGVSTSLHQKERLLPT